MYSLRMVEAGRSRLEVWCVFEFRITHGHETAFATYCQSFKNVSIKRIVVTIFVIFPNLLVYYVYACKVSKVRMKALSGREIVLSGPQR
jgi:hypothetical protein